MKVEFFPAAEQELLEAADQYERQLQGLGTDFVAEVERVAGVLTELHSLGEKLDGIHRRLPLRRFPSLSSIAVTQMPCASWRSRIGGAGHGTGGLESRSANKRLSCVGSAAWASGLNQWRSA